MQSVGQQIRAARTAVKMTRERLAYASGIALATVRRAESGKGIPQVEHLIAIVKVLEVPLEFEFDGATVVLAEITQFKKLVGKLAREAQK